jgi:perosamine synthetase
MAIKSLNLPKNSKILTTPITFVSTNSAILYEEHIPVFCEIEKYTGNISVQSIEKNLKHYGDEIKAIVVVHLGGYPCDMDAINKIAEEYKIPVIEDCAHAFGAKYKGAYIGNTENLCTWSFQAVKNMPVGDGGGISTKNKEKDDLFKKLIWLGADKTTIDRSKLDSKKQTYNWDYEIVELGFKYHSNDIVSTIGLNQLKYIKEDNKRRKEIAQFYIENIDKNQCVFPEYEKDRESSYHFFPILFHDRDSVYKRLTNNNIFPGMHYKRNDNYKIFNKFKKYIIEDLNNVDFYEKHELTLPIHLHLTDEDLNKIISVINNG